MNEFPAWEISKLTSYIKGIIESDSSLHSIWVRGELSNFKRHTSGHAYFSLKDSMSSIRCVMFRSRSVGLTFNPKNGDQVLVKGSVSVYERDGAYQLYVDEMKSDGIGDLHLAFEQLKSKLLEEGLFDSSYKKTLPYLPRKVGVVTSSTGAAVRDIISVLRRRFDNVTIILVSVRVQGDEAPIEIAQAIESLNEHGEADVIIVARGGGSFEELNAFNAEVVARSIFQSKIPIVSAVGHETDFTIADFVADLRAPTPSAAAEIVIPDKKEIKKSLYSIETRITFLLKRRYEIESKKIQQVLSRPVMSRPKASFEQHYQDLDFMMKSSTVTMQNNVKMQSERFVKISSVLNTLSPLNILGRGYSLCTRVDTGEAVRSIQNVNLNEKIQIRLQDGNLISQVKEINQEVE